MIPLLLTIGTDVIDNISISVVSTSTFLCRRTHILGGLKEGFPPSSYCLRAAEYTHHDIFADSLWLGWSGTHFHHLYVLVKIQYLICFLWCFFAVLIEMCHIVLFISLSICIFICSNSGIKVFPRWEVKFITKLNFALWIRRLHTRFSYIHSQQSSLKIEVWLVELKSSRLRQNSILDSIFINYSHEICCTIMSPVRTPDVRHSAYATSLLHVVQLLLRPSCLYWP